MRQEKGGRLDTSTGPTRVTRSQAAAATGSGFGAPDSDGAAQPAAGASRRGSRYSWSFGDAACSRDQSPTGTLATTACGQRTSRYE
jgi:hypothetical protein